MVKLNIIFEYLKYIFSLLFIIINMLFKLIVNSNIKIKPTKKKFCFILNIEIKAYVNKNGDRVPRVSEVIKTLAKDSLITWANFLGFKHIDYRKELERTRNIGSLCHDVLEGYFDKNRLADIDFD